MFDKDKYRNLKLYVYTIKITESRQKLSNIVAVIQCGFFSHTIKIRTFILLYTSSPPCKKDTNYHTRLLQLYFHISPQKKMLIHSGYIIGSNQIALIGNCYKDKIKYISYRKHINHDNFTGSSDNNFPTLTPNKHMAYH